MSRAASLSASGCSIWSTKRASACSTPTRNARPNGPSRGRRYSGTSLPIAAMMASVIAGRTGLRGAASVGGSGSCMCAEATASSPNYKFPPATRTRDPQRRETPAPSLKVMSRSARIAYLGAVIVPFLAFLAAIVLLWNQIVGWHDLVLLVVMYLLAGFGITVGYHRMLTHRAFHTST